MTKSSRNRVAFSFLYNANTSKVVNLVAQGHDTPTIATRTGLSSMSVAATKANLTRGTYYPFAYVDIQGYVRGTCSY